MKTLSCSTLLFISLFLSCGSLQAQDSPLYKNSNAPVEQRVDDLLARMTLEEKIDMIGGYNDFYIRPNERLGIPMIKMSDGPLGVRNYGPATAFPAGIAFAATWNVDLVRAFGRAVGKECRSKGVHIILAPGVNIYRAPMCGRNFEYYGEDPYLASRMVVAYVNGVQSEGVVATAKHYAANNQEYDRYTVSSDVDERTLREIYLPAFRAAVEEAHIGAVMTAYNLVNGVHCSQNEHLIKDILKDDWKFDGIVMSDWVSTWDGVAAANAGLDLEMPSGAFMNRKNLLPALQEGKVKVATIDDKIRRMLRVMFRMGFFDREQTDASLPLYNPDSRFVALQAARESIVLLKNKNNVLPLDRSKISSIAVVGPNAHPAVTGGGGSSRVQPFRAVSPLEGIINLAGNNVKVFYSAGIAADFSEIFGSSRFLTITEQGAMLSGLKGEYFANMNLSGTPAFSRQDKHLDFKWLTTSPMNGFPADSFSIRWTGKIKPEKSGDYEFFVRGDDGYRLYLDRQLVIDNWRDQPATVRKIVLSLQANQLYDIMLEYYEHGGYAEIGLGYRQKIDPEKLEAVRLASKADVTVACLGFNADTESEGFDRPFNLPEEQVALLHEVAKVSRQTIVILTAGGHVAMSEWLDEVDGLLHAWYPGQEGGTALAEILFGAVNPSAKLPVSFEQRWEDNATFNSYYDTDHDKRVKYSEGIFVGYRHFDQNNIEPLFPFGFGLSYTTFEYKNLRVTPGQITKGQKVTIEFEITNTGKHAGTEIAQLYIRDVRCRVERPPKELKAFDRVWLKPGETRKVNFELDESALSFYDPNQRAWVAEPGEFQVLIGSSSRHIRFQQSFYLK
ncbi:MAG: glycoside hydrolase family 3 C-terminal domain-containing protein [candidate division KSB1 bacterium]|nr:glycoside hydrolase family 3 C-terminal domain-containing protein [candidate division KSB1 bacterium]MDZ7302399.1 glycoside hydrolase family 3 C-terminal domain-containing protein [candidate division KSB1 bacterium]MDZ7311602.1 glycoside hydrolase family 3 C-terminal domain-containing protein [candidate division KSB1 bacterium]